jgi:hypothetical protein
MTDDTHKPTEKSDPRLLRGGSASSVGLSARRRRHLIAVIVVFGIALSVRLKHHQDAVQSDYFRGNPISMGDSGFYHQAARSIAEGRWISDDVFFMAPLYQYSLAVVYRFLRTPGGVTPDGEPAWNYDLPGALRVQCAAGALTPVLVYWLAAMLGGPLIGMLAGLTAALYGVLIYYDALLMPTSQIVFMHALFLCLLVTGGRRGGGIWWAATGLSLGLCAAAHGTALLLILPALLWLWKSQPNLNRARRLSRAVVLCAACAAVISPITLHNWIAGRDFVLLTSNAGSNFFIGNHPQATGTFVSQRFPFKRMVLDDILLGVERTPEDPPPSEVSRTIAADAWRFIRQQPAAELGLLWRKFRLFFHSVEICIRDNFYFFRQYSTVLQWPLPSFGLIAPIGLTGCVFVAQLRRDAWPIVLVIAAQAAAFVIMFVLGRYRLFSAVCLIVMAMLQIQWWLERLRARDRRALAWSLAVLVPATVFVHWPIDGVTPTRGFGQQYHALAVSLIGQHRFDDALAALEKSVESDYAPNDPHARRADAYYIMAQIHYRRGQWKGVLEAARQSSDELSKASGAEVTVATHEKIDDLIWQARQRLQR